LSIPATYSEEQLVLALKNRDRQAFGYLYDHYSAALYTIIRQILRDPDRSDDVLQEVFTNIWRKIETYDPEKGRIFTWMLNIARNASIDTLRSKDFRQARQNQELSETVDFRMESRAVQPNFDHIGLRKALEGLRPEYREVIELAYYKGYTHEEIADSAKIPLGTVKTRIRSALIQLRAHLRQT
jgi:RNA polymerase sigma factor (sigma-70 family)